MARVIDENMFPQTTLDKTQNIVIIVDFSQFCSTTVEIRHLVGRLSISELNSSILGISLKFPNF